MAPHDDHGSTLSAQRAFVVHLGATGAPGRRRFTGRVEHLSSGESAHFSSLRGLLAFFAAILDAQVRLIDPAASGRQPATRTERRNPS